MVAVMLRFVTKDMLCGFTCPTFQISSENLLMQTKRTVTHNWDSKGTACKTRDRTDTVFH